MIAKHAARIISTTTPDTPASFASTSAGTFFSLLPLPLLLLLFPNGTAGGDNLVGLIFRMLLVIYVGKPSCAKPLLIFAMRCCWPFSNETKAKSAALAWPICTSNFNSVSSRRD
jgi:hypothetical protein